MMGQDFFEETLATSTSSSARFEGANAYRRASRPFPILTVSTLVGTDAISLAIIFELMTLICSGLLQEYFPTPSALRTYTFIFLIAYAANGLYPAVGIRPHEELKRLTVATSLVYLILGATVNISRILLFSCWLVSLLVLPLSRTLVKHLFAASSWWGVPVLILGSGTLAKNLVQQLQRQPTLGFKPVALIDDHFDGESSYRGVPCITPLSETPSLARKWGVSHAIVCEPKSSQDSLVRMMETCAPIFSNVMIVPKLLNQFDLWVTPKDMGGLMGLEIKHNLLSPTAQLIKRMMDLALTIVGGLVILPILLFIALLVRLDSPGPVLFTQSRLGKDGKHFKVFKFRTMYIDAERRLSEILQNDLRMRQEYEVYHKLTNDPRITPIGRILRKLSLDELPQLWNVLRGEMSLIGPRAYMTSELSKMNNLEPTILKVVPGISGLWQVSGRNKLSFAQRLNLDIYYVRNWSIWLDIYLLASTFRALLQIRNAS